jgi:hypothetical protein
MTASEERDIWKGIVDAGRPRTVAEAKVLAQVICAYVMDTEEIEEELSDEDRVLLDAARQMQDRIDAAWARLAGPVAEVADGK